jgi:hypothetical protein
MPDPSSPPHEHEQYGSTMTKAADMLLPVRLPSITCILQRRTLYHPVSARPIPRRATTRQPRPNPRLTEGPNPTQVWSHGRHYRTCLTQPPDLQHQPPPGLPTRWPVQAVTTAYNAIVWSAGAHGDAGTLKQRSIGGICLDQQYK